MLVDCGLPMMISLTLGHTLSMHFKLSFTMSANSDVPHRRSHESDLSYRFVRFQRTHPLASVHVTAT